MKVKTVTVIGANGVMGRNVAGIFASFGDAKVNMVSRTIEKSKQAINESCLSVKSLSIKDNMVARDYSELEICIKESDLIFESVAEDFDVKYEINTIINKYANENTVICTGTSGLSITDLSKAFDNIKRKNYIGVHMFNPPYNLTLCELIVTEFNEDILSVNLEKYLKDILKRSVVKVKDKPAFLANRIGFYFINYMLKLAEKYEEKGGIDFIDYLFSGYTGRAMAPILTADFVGLDVHKAIVDNIHNNTSDNYNECFTLPSFVNKLIQENKLGRKTKGGLYKSIKDSDGNNIRQVYDIKYDKYRDIVIYDLELVNVISDYFKNGNYLMGLEILKNDNTEEGKLVRKELIKFILYSINVSNEVCFAINSIDTAMAEGFNWCPPIAWIDALGGGNELIRLCKINSIEVDNKMLDIIKELPKSSYNFKRYLRATR